MKMKLVIFLCLVCHGIALASASGTYNVMDFGAKANGVTDDSQAFLAAWKQACNSSGQTKVLVPVGTYFLNPVEFSGPCPGNGEGGDGLEQIQTDPWLGGLYICGPLDLDWRRDLQWPGRSILVAQQLPQTKELQSSAIGIHLISLHFEYTNNTVVKDITSINSKFFHVALMNCNNFQGSGITIKAPDNSPNTDGIHLESNSGVTISSSNIGTGDDCVSIGQGNSFVTVSGINCGPGHGISVGSLGRYNTEKDVKNLIVRDSTFIGTVTGVRIKTWANSPIQTTAQNITFSNLIMKNVGNPIIVDQTYCPYSNCDNSVPSRVQLKDITFKDIRGTVQYKEAITLKCSKGFPCQGLKLENINLQSSGTQSVVSVCLDARAIYSGQINPTPCN
ncbi:hypothetical protein ZIOFF_016489 [Zingiber officinale]|uniref:Polygalacturonase n=1 Tax=Zingiber officinale TaxID=94328 RepID=A0A8J5HW54_ZINOF|nr:hypothetical protein ZIOFF_016489 [Zingiber officinale]